ncbi:MAG: M1 family metallopeptidase [Polyangiaceae bacterium]
MRRSLRTFAIGSVVTLLGCIPSEPRAPIPPPRPFVPPPPVTSAPPPRPALPPEAAPLGKLPSDVRPLRGNVVIQIDPRTDRFAGTVEYEVDFTQPRDVIWLHGQDIHPRSATVRIDGSAPVQATYGEVDPSGVAALRLAQPIGPGRGRIRIDYDAPFQHSDEGLFVSERGGKKYAFTQFEATAARRALPCFDEPAFKIPWDVTLFVPRGMQAISNTSELAQVEAPGDTTRVTFKTTAPLPSYLLAFAVGPLDVVTAPEIPANEVRKRPLALRGVATAGRGKELSYALAHAGEIVAGLEKYFGIEYPFDKLDLIAVPDKRGAMENAGAITFGEWLLLVDEAKAPIAQKRAFWAVTAHELAHQWFGDLVTMPWWDDVWLNEAFATWMETRAVNELRPESSAAVGQIRATEDAMALDSLVSSRQIRQDIRSHNDISNAFDGITYEKGAGVIGMFERWVGKDAFRTGISSYLSAHRGGNATADDLFAALSVAAGRDVGAPFRTFVNQPGVPLVEAKLVCGGGGSFLSLKQSRHLPLGSAGDPNRTWQIPVCAKVPDGKGTKEACTLLTTTEGSLPLPTTTCPAWVMPNADAAGYYVFSMPPADMKKLATAGYKDLTRAERLALVHALRTSWTRGTEVADVLPLLLPLVKDSEREVVQAAMEPYRVARSWFSGADRAAVEKAAQKALAPAWKALGWEAKKGQTEDDDRRTLRGDVLGFMVFTAHDPTVRKEAIAKGRAFVGYGGDGQLHTDAVDSDLAGICLAAAAEEADAPFFDHLVRTLDRTTSDIVRNRLIAAIGSARAPDLAARALAFTFDPRVPQPQLTAILDQQLGAPETRDAAWQWFGAHVDEIAAKRPPSRRGALPWMGAVFCDRAHADALSSLFQERIQKLDGGPRNLAAALEAIHLCVAKRAVQEPSLRKALKLPAPKADKKADTGSSGLLDPWANGKNGKNGKGPAGPADPFGATPPTQAPSPNSPAPAPQKSDGLIDPWAKKKPKK